ncbi:D-2-hydroxyacid dehydrogenase [Parabacteroides sp. FAFU027]|uniref:D-2-hydroxyacid dehydrogenase n=1 Tax=Parabacteroides sp. FAFU027 TaxID=2922715 RepID=UPI001FAF9825|nr:D-2-hydroxyacid dehydrogenase [Parabacteroides sp. FAFU027]
MKIVFLDAYSVGDVDMTAISRLGEYVQYETTQPSQVIERCADADVVITNKVKLMQPELDALPNLKLICIAATGMNNVDLSHAAIKGIPVKNVANYSTDSVAELTLSLVMGLVQSTGYYDRYVKSGEYGRSGLFTHHGRPYFEIKGKTWGIIGLGNIGSRVAQIATVLGAKVVYNSTSGKNHNKGFDHKSLDELLAESDIITIHAPLNERTQNLLDYEKLCRMKPSALLVNVGRGGIVKEADLVQALREGRLAGAGLDVFEQEPLAADHTLLSADIQDKLLLTPHIAWASVEARQRLVNMIAKHIEAITV